MKFTFEYTIKGTVVREADTLEDAQANLEGDIDWAVDELPGEKDWYFSDSGEV